MSDRHLMKIGVLVRMNFQKLVREKIVYSFAFVALALILFSLLLGALSFDEQSRILVHFGSSSILFSMMTVSLIVGANLMQKEIREQTILLTLARPISRSSFFIAEWLSLVIVVLINVLILSCVIAFLTQGSFSFISFLIAEGVAALEIILIFTVSMLFSLFVRPVVAIFTGFGVFLIGHWLPDMIFFAEKSKNEGFMFLAKWTHQFFPQLYRFQIQSFSLIQKGFSFDEVIFVLIHGLAWTVFLLTLALFIFRRKDLV